MQIVTHEQMVREIKIRSEMIEVKMVMVEDIDSIISKYKKMVKENDKDAKAHRELGIAYSVKGDYDSAIKELKTAAKLDPKSAESHYALGLAMDMAGKQRRGHRALQRSDQAQGTISSKPGSASPTPTWNRASSTMRCRPSTS